MGPRETVKHGRQTDESEKAGEGDSRVSIPAQAVWTVRREGRYITAMNTSPVGHTPIPAPGPSSPASRPSTRRGGPVRRLLRKALRNWRERHRERFNFAIHLVGIPVAVAGVLLLGCAAVDALTTELGVALFPEVPWSWALAAVVVGYFLQWVGHCVEGNDVGEWAAVKRLVGLPYVGIAPRWQGVPLDDARPGPTDNR